MTDEKPFRPLALGKNGEWVPLPEGWTEPMYPPGVEAEVRARYAPPAVFRARAAHYLCEAVAVLPESVFSPELGADRVGDLLSHAVDASRAAFLRPDESEAFLEKPPSNELQRRRRQIHDEEIPKVRAFLADPKARETALPIFEETAEAFSALMLALVRIFRAAPFKGEGEDEFTRAPMPWAAHGLRRAALRWFTTGTLRVLDTRGPGSKYDIRDPLEAARLSPEEIDAAAGRIRLSLLETVKAFPFGRPFPSVGMGLDPEGEIDPEILVIGPEKPIEDVWAYLEPLAGPWRKFWEAAPPGKERPPLLPWEWRAYVLAWTGGDVLERILEREIQTLVAREGAAAAEARALARPHVSIPSPFDIPVLFNAGVPFRDQARRFAVIPNEKESGELESVTFSLRKVKTESISQLTLFGEEALGRGVRNRKLDPVGWRSEALSLLPSILGPGTLALYYATWQGLGSDGEFLFHPAVFLDLFGMKNDTRARARIERDLEELTRVEIRIETTRGPSMGKRTIEVTDRLISKTPLRGTIFTPGRPRMKFSSYRHALGMLELQRDYHVKVPREAFRLVGGWREGAGVKEDGVKAFALVASAYVLARTYATRPEGAKAGRRYHGPGGYEIPLEEILTLSGFTTPKNLKQNPGQVTERAAEAVERLTREFGLFGPGSTVRGDRFRFDPPPALRTDLEGIAAKGTEVPAELPADPIDVPRKARRKRPGGRGRGRK